MECPVCYTCDEEPKRLSCKHTLCAGCCKRILGNGQSMRCPLCKAVTRVPDGLVANLPTNLLHQKIHAIYKEHSREEYIRCGFCRQDTTVYDIKKCLDCKKEICPKCTTRHREMPQFRSHTIQMKAQLLCKQHMCKECKFYCSDCDKFLCVMCINKCKGHYDKLKSVIDMKGDLEQEVKAFIDKTQTATYTRDGMKRTIAKIEQNLIQAVQIKDVIHTNANKLIANIRKQETDLIEEVEKWEKAMREIKHGITLAAKDLHNIEELRKSAEEGLRSNTENLIIACSLIKTMSRDVSQIPSLDEASISFTHCETLACNIGMVHTKYPAKLQSSNEPSNTCNIGGIQTKYPPGKQTLHELSGSETYNSNMTPRQRWQTCGLQLGTDVTFTPQGHIIVTDFDAKNVIMYSSEGEVITSSKQKGVKLQGYPWRLTHDPHESAIIVTTGGNLVFLKEEDLSFIRRVKLKGQGEARGIGVLSNGQIVVGTWNPHTVSIYNRQGKLKKQIKKYTYNNTQQDVSGPGYICILPGDTILVSMYGNGHTVYLSADLATQSVNAVSKPGGITVGQAGRVLVVARDPDYTYGPGDVYELVNNAGVNTRSILKFTQEKSVKYKSIRSIAMRDNKLVALFGQCLCLYEWL